MPGQVASGVSVPSGDGRTPTEALVEIRRRVMELSARQAKLWRRELLPLLADQDIDVGNVGDLRPRELAELTERFEHELFPILTPLAVGPGQPFPYISGLSLSLGLFVRDPETAEQRFARVKVPELLPRFLPVGDSGVFLALEDVIAHFLPLLFPEMEIVERGAFRVTRDADFEVSDEADDLLEAVELELRRRRFGDAVRVEVSDSMSAEMREGILEGVDAAAEQLYPIAGLLDMADLMELARLERPDLKDDPWLAVTQPRIAELGTAAAFFEEIRRGDILVHHPYESFNTSFEAFVRGAGKDRNVLGLKTTVYRTSDETPLVPALIDAAEEGKQTVCLVELKARFDEHRNIEWSRALERAGVHVVYGFPNLKIHAKATLIVRREGNDLRRYVHIGTGNYHAINARVYEDFGLFTADPEIGAEAQSAEAGKKAVIRIKVNALTDQAVIEELYEASQAGAEIDIVARGVCALRPGVPGMSENIRVRSIVGRFLEHSRLFILESNKKSTYLLGSADLMPRNLDHRLEIVVPVEDSYAQQRLASVFDALLSDNAQAWELGSDGTWERIKTAKDERPKPAHAALMRSVRARFRRRAEPPRRGR